ncbi:MAG: hypothetical protein JRI36_03605 [Deltaproteobacteria bacterium]|nr:hypothetical protein [Deltaproteobacteria bacterium]
MKLDPNPSFRKVPVPWHGSDAFCLVIAMIMAVVFVFARIGLRLTCEVDAYHDYAWLPIVLMILSGGILVANITRVLTRMIKHRPEEDE